MWDSITQAYPKPFKAQSTTFPFISDHFFPRNVTSPSGPKYQSHSSNFKLNCFQNIFHIFNNYYYNKNDPFINVIKVTFFYSSYFFFKVFLNKKHF